MNVVLLGVGIGLLTIIPPGPVSLTLVQVGARLGHQPALRGALGVAAGDFVLAAISVLIVGAGTALPPLTFAITQSIAAAVLALLGIVLLLRPSAAGDSIGRIQRPGRTLFAITSLTPSALGAWIALLAAMPFAHDQRQLSLFAVGVVIASFFWHPLLGAAASRLGSRLNDDGYIRLSQVGGAIMVALAIGLASRQLL